MIKKTICISNPSFLKKQDEQLVVEQGENKQTIPIEDIGVLILDHYQITATTSCLSAILANNGIIITCNKSHHPDGIMLPVEGHVTHAETLKAQVESSLPLRKQLWQQTIKTKINNQAYALHSSGSNPEPLLYISKQVKSGDTSNCEGRAAVAYWKNFFSSELKFRRDREGSPPNNLLNYGYTVLRAQMARAIVSAGLHPALGIHHKNRYNAFSLADDLMEPYRPFIDIVVRNIVVSECSYELLTPELKHRLLSTLNNDVYMENERKPLQLAVMRTATSLAQIFREEESKIAYPEINATE